MVRDVCLSATTWHQVDRLRNRFPTWRTEPVATAALWWELHVRLARGAGTGLESGLYRELRYEELVARPAEVSARLCEFLALTYSDAMTRYNEGRTKRRSRPGLEQAVAAADPRAPRLADTDAARRRAALRSGGRGPP